MSQKTTDWLPTWDCGSRDQWVKRTIGVSDPSLNIPICMVLTSESILILYKFEK